MTEGWKGWLSDKYVSEDIQELGAELGTVYCRRKVRPRRTVVG